MTISAIPSTTTPAAPSSLLPQQTLDQDDFLKLVVAQMANQDPMNPMKDTEFIAQMAQFSALEQAKAMQADIALLRAQNQLLQANGLIGRQVELQTGGGSLTSGVVSGIAMEAGIPKLVVNGQRYELSTVFSVAPAPTNAAAPAEQGAQP